jgi:hypothetical protein
MMTLMITAMHIANYLINIYSSGRKLFTVFSMKLADKVKWNGL